MDNDEKESCDVAVQKAEVEESRLRVGVTATIPALEDSLKCKKEETDEVIEQTVSQNGFYEKYLQKESERRKATKKFYEYFKEHSEILENLINVDYDECIEVELEPSKVIEQTVSQSGFYKKYLQEESERRKATKKFYEYLKEHSEILEDLINVDYDECIEVELEPSKVIEEPTVSQSGSCDKYLQVESERRKAIKKFYEYLNEHSEILENFNNLDYGKCIKEELEPSKVIEEQTVSQSGFHEKYLQQEIKQRKAIKQFYEYLGKHDLENMGVDGECIKVELEQRKVTERNDEYYKMENAELGNLISEIKERSMSPLTTFDIEDDFIDDLINFSLMYDELPELPKRIKSPTGVDRDAHGLP